MRVLHTTVELPLPSAGSGGAIRQFHLLRRLAELGHEVTVLAPGLPGDPAIARAQRALGEAGIELAVVQRPPPPALEPLRAAAHDPLLLPAILWRPWYPWQFEVSFASVRPRLEELIADRGPDVLVFEHDDLAGWGAAIAPGIPRALTAHNVTWRLFERRAAVARGARRMALRAEAARHRRYVAQRIGCYDGVIAVSEGDGRELTALGARRIHVIPNGADTATIAPQPDHGDPPRVLFVGSMDHPPNPEGISWFAAQAWPKVLEAVPAARLVVVGRGRRDALRSLEGRPGIDVLGEVPDVLPHLREATVVVAPLRSGGGSRLKVLEAMAAQRAVVATHIGAEGIDVEDGRQVLLADDPRGLADACVRLLRDEGSRRALAGAARELARSRYDWAVLGDALGAALSSLAR